MNTVATQEGRMELPALEKDLCGQVKVNTSSRSIHTEVLEAFVAARVAVDAMLAKTECHAPQAAAELLELKRALWWNWDRTFVLEVAYIKAITGRQGGVHLIARATNMLPDGASVC